MSSTVCLLTSAACGSSATTVTSPSSLTRCSISIQSLETPVPAAGGAAAINVTAARDCTWTASTEGNWLSIKSGSSGQGDGTIELTAAGNPDPVMRRGAILANGQRAEVSQAAAVCEITLVESSANFAQGGGSGQVQVRASSGMCTWSASADADWIQIRNANGQGTGIVSFDVPASAGPPRSATITIAGQKFSVVQSEGCAFTIDPPSLAAQPSGGSRTVNITTTIACPWTASSNAEWIKVTPAQGTGPGFATVTVGATSGPARTGTAVIAGELFNVTQSQGCFYAVQPQNGSAGAAGGTVTVTITTDRACPWTATSDVPWITFENRSSGSGDGTVGLVVAATSGPSRTGTATVAGQRVTITQTAGCTYGIAPDTASVAAAGGTGKVAVTAGAGCTWTASSNAPWLTLTSGAAGSGNGEVQYSAASTTGPVRSGTLTIAGRTFTVNQGTGCSYALSAPGQSVPAAGGTGSVNVVAGSGCAWTATSNAPWLSITSGANGSGGGTVGFSAAVHTGPARTGTLTIAGQTFTVTQGEGCTFTIAPDQAPVGAAAATVTVSVASPAGCGWTASTVTAWLHVTAGAAGSGSGSVQIAVDANTAGARSGTATIANQTFTVNQSSGCTYVVTPDPVTVVAAGGTRRVDIASAASCGWTAAENESWFSIASAPNGTGNGGIDLAIDANPGPARTGILTVAGRTVTVSQDSGCTVTLNPTSQAIPAAGGTGTVAVSSTAGCPWTAASTVPWIAITGGSPGSGGGSVQYTVEANTTGAPRAGTITIGGATLTVNQD